MSKQHKARRRATLLGVPAATAAIALAPAGPTPVAQAASPYCGASVCSGDDSATYTAGRDQTYVGEIGNYAYDFNGTTGPCPGFGYQSGVCFNPTAAAGAQSLYVNSQGLGVEFYYFGAGSGLYAAEGQPSAYCWGWKQGYAAVNHALNTFGSYLPAVAIALDVDAYNQFGWNNNFQQNRAVLNGFSDYVSGAASTDGNCTYHVQAPAFQPFVYSANASVNPIWTDVFGVYGSIPNMPAWTFEYCCTNTYPAGWGSGSTGAQLFGGTSYKSGWQYDQSPPLAGDYDIWEDPWYLPLFNQSIG